jgi:hypothetical protein
MNDRLQRALDNEITPNELTPALSAELDEARSHFAAVLRSIPAEPLPDLAAAVLRRIDSVEKYVSPRRTETEAPRARSSPASWLWSPHRMSISIRPIYAAGLAAVLTLVVGVRDTGPDRTGSESSAAITASQREVLVHFRLEAPHARIVSLAGDFSNWSPSYTLKRSGPGVWTIVIPLTPGVHDYSFIIDGEKWVPDPSAPAMPDGFGGMNSRVAVLAPDRRT